MATALNARIGAERSGSGFRTTAEALGVRKSLRKRPQQAKGLLYGIIGLMSTKGANIVLIQNREATTVDIRYVPPQIDSRRLEEPH